MLIWINFFFAGMIDILGLPKGPINLIALGTVGLLFMESFRRRKIRFPLLVFVLSLGVITLVSGPYLNGTSTVSAFFFFRQLILLQYLYMFIIVNESDDSIIFFVKKMIIYLYLFQIIAAFIKLFTVGLMESYIGTMSIRQGSLTTIIVMVATSYLFSMYLCSKKKELLFIMVLFFGFGLIGEKRSIFVFVPFVMALTFLYQIKIQHKNLVYIIKVCSIFFISIAMLVYVTCRANPTLNKEREVWGEFDLAYAMDYIVNYNFGDTDVEHFSRPQALEYLAAYLVSQNLEVMLFGEGAGKLSLATLDSDEDPIHYYYGIRYGGRMGIVWVFLQIGVLGVALYVLLYLKMLLFVIRKCKSPEYKLAFWGLWICIMMDLFIYSMVSINFFVINGPFFFLFAVIYRDYIKRKRASKFFRVQVKQESLYKNRHHQLQNNINNSLFLPSTN